MGIDDAIVGTNVAILVTGANGFVGTRVIKNLLLHGYENIRCFVRPSSDTEHLENIIDRYSTQNSTQKSVEFIRGNLIRREDCNKATEDIELIYHLAAGRGEKSFPNAYLNSVVTTRNLLDSILEQSCLKRFVSVSSFSVYTNRKKPRGRVLDESCPVEKHPWLRGEAYCYAKVKQDEIVLDYGKKHGIPYVIVRPAVVYGEGNSAITGRVGIGTFGVFLHIGGSNTIPLTYVENCAEAIVLSGLRKGIEREVFNVVDDNLPSSRTFLRQYKRKVKRFRSIFVPHVVSFLFCGLWEMYSRWSNEQLPPVFNRKRWYNDWKGSKYSNKKLKRMIGWVPAVSTSEGLDRFFASCKKAENHA
jgi:nucleoside-diphosphate-sugar epimerase